MAWPRRCVAVALVALAACSSDGGTRPDVRTAGIYEAALRWVLAAETQPPAAEDDLPVVYVVSANGRSIAAQAQVAVVDAMNEDATLRFTDAREDALDVDVDGRPVMDEGVLVIVGPVADGSPVDLEVEVYRDQADDRAYMLRVSGGGDNWRVTAASEDS